MKGFAMLLLTGLLAKYSRVDVGMIGGTLILLKRLQYLFVVTPLLILTVWLAQARAGQLQFAWDAPTTNTDGTPLTNLAGYHLYYWQGSSETPQSVDVGNQTTYMLTGLVDGATYSFAVTAYNTLGVESSDSQAITATVS